MVAAALMPGLPEARRQQPDYPALPRWLKKLPHAGRDESESREQLAPVILDLRDNSARLLPALGLIAKTSLEHCDGFREGLTCGVLPPARPSVSGTPPSLPPPPTLPARAKRKDPPTARARQLPESPSVVPLGWLPVGKKW